MGQADHVLDEDEVALLVLLPADGTPADSNEIRVRLGWEAERYAGTGARLEERGYIVARQGQGKTLGRDLTAVPPEFRTACGRPGSTVTVRQVPVTVLHALCDLTGVILSYPGRGGATVPDSPGGGVGNSLGIQVQVDAHTQDVTVTVSGAEDNALSGLG
jgi:hypothetical protein